MAKRVNKRKWLNPSDSADTGAVHLWGNYDEDGYGMEIDLALWDCSRKINLCFSVWTPKDYKTRMRKIAVMREALDDMESFINENYSEFEKQYRERKKEDKKKRKAQDSSLAS